MPDSTPPTAPVSSNISAAPAGPSNLRLRVIYGVLGAALLLGSVWFSPWTFGLFFAAVQAVMLWEFYRMMRAGGYAPATWIGIGAGIAFFLLAGLLSQELAGNNHVLIVRLFLKSVASLALVLPVILVLREIAIWKGGEKAFANIGTTLLGILYVSLPMALLTVIAQDKPGGYSGNTYYETYDYRRVFALLFLIWASDIGAYAAGKTFGKHKLAPKISPGKTWEGWAGGFVLTLVVGWALGYLLPDLPLTHRLVAAGVVAVFAPLGDLAESMLKRSVGVKDSGSIMPGHGGLLDRFDAFLLVLPVLALLQLLAG
ncbi:phosphatidate cytidylyltransferase [Hymenobacter frigidus]|uniref:Phosphatidate cytidylyltransferase n=1 Tax=Hymenobacter frigidus TaxID=1524095 RepID=A0ABQ2AB79_9BACT|nr:phosphatidate cytidylyltransferase [Hymenobacter frigidus]GGH89007.1 phosphatidate cytidylyltransferase [Hymenobacter frigidus]